MSRYNPSSFLDLQERGYNVMNYGAGKGSADDSSVIQNLINVVSTLANGGTVYFPAGVFLVKSALTLKPKVHLSLSEQAIIRANAPISGALITTPLTTFLQYQSIRGGQIDCNFLANIGVEVAYARGFTVENVVVFNSLLYGFKAGDNSATSSSYEIRLKNCNTEWLNAPGGQTIPSNTYGLWIENITDSYFSDCVFVNHQNGVMIQGGDHHFDRVHVWNHTYLPGMVYGFNINGSDNTLDNCTADQCETYGFWIQKDHTILTNGTVIKTSGTNNKLIAIRDEQGYNIISHVNIFGTSLVMISQDYQISAANISDFTQVSNFTSQYVTTRTVPIITTGGAPTYGTWVVGDTIVNSSPTASGVDRWRCVTAGYANTLNWASNVAYNSGTKVTANGNVYQCITAGTSATSGTGPSGTGTSIADGSCVWSYMNVAAVFKTVGLSS